MLAKIQLLQRSPLCEGLNEHTVTNLLSLVEFRRFGPNECIVSEGEDALHVFFVVTGIVRLTRGRASGRETDVGICEPGDVFSEYLVPGGRSHALTAWAADSAEVAAIDLLQLRILAAEHPGVLLNLMRIASRHLVEAFECIAGDRSQTAAQRVANYFLRHCPRSATQASFRLPYRKRILAGKLGLAPEALSRAFSALSDVGVVVAGKTVRIDNVEMLRTIC
ncbi:MULTISPECIES: Crp/Fnr family transcriptional regulator [Rhizobium]|uniref:CRP-like cAMP-binding protein n=1 Tax=Rhizobium paranaense TaxID=1650438 RepID=A0A7W9D3Q9_9HYPH|nr:Crp/Fnr family transcriptional regulator [Rhizobium paranaense]MBB5576558.1 CRP-like cAMP-binding protein [Rhizobium paranaense]